MTLTKVVEKFKKRFPLSIMMQLTLAKLFSAERMDQIFADHAVKQRSGELLFSSVADLMGMVVIRLHPSINAAYVNEAEESLVSVTSVYNKLKGIEPQVSRAMVSLTAADLVEVFDAFKIPADQQSLLGFEVRIADGNHLAATEHRIEELRTIGDAPLPGHSIPILDPHRRLIVDVIPCEDGHAQERTLFPELLEAINPQEVLVGDRNFCTKALLFGLAGQRSYFVIRHNLGTIQKWESQGRQRKIGPVEGGVLYEQKIVITHEGRERTLRRITVKLDVPTRKGDTEIHILTNLPQRVSAKQISQTYRGRWQIEAAFGQLASDLETEIQTLGYPDAALFGFCMGLLLFNVVSILKTAIQAANVGAEITKPTSVNRPTTSDSDELTHADLSSYYMVIDIRNGWQAIDTLFPAAELLDHFQVKTNVQLARCLAQLATKVATRKLFKNYTGPKKPKPKRTRKKRGDHVSTARIIAQRKRELIA